MIRALIVEDASLVRKGLRLFLQQEEDIEVVGEACDGPEAVDQIYAHRPDLVLLDIQMPGFDGFEVLARTRCVHIRAVIFVTAHSDFALRAFEHNAVSYLLKPIDPVRFRDAIARARILIGKPRTDGDAEPEDTISPSPGEIQDVTIAAAPGSGHRLSRLLIKNRDRFILVRTEDIDWIAATGEYTTLHTRVGTRVVRMPISALAARLDENQFARIHRCAIVNLDRIREILPRSHGDCDVLLENGRQLRLSRSYRERIFSRAF
ncbi:MAG: LytR/AlgR family response regulator transcription factor [Steroidobacteraceae bacterium]